MVLSGLLVIATPGAFVAAASPHGTYSAVAPPVMTGSQLQASSYLTNPASQINSTSAANIVGSTAPTAPSSFTIGFAMQNETELAQILDEQQVQGSPTYHHWLTLAQEQQMFAPAPSVVQNTINYFTSLGFKVQTRGLLSVSFSGTTAQSSQAFKTDFVDVNVGNGTVDSMNDLPLSLPSPIAPYISTVNGLDTNTPFHVEHFLNPSLTDAVLGQPTGGSMSPAAGAQPLSPPNSNNVNISALYNFSNHAFGFAYWYSVNAQSKEYLQIITPGSLSYLYNALPLVNAGYNGAGTSATGPITIAIVMGGGINPDDLKEYGQQVWNNPNNILDRLSVDPIDGAYQLNGTLLYSDGVSGEMALDIEYSSTMAPGAHILAVYGPGLYDNVLDDDYAAIAGMTKIPNIVSNSWGGAEDGSNYYGYSWDNDITMHQYFMLIDGRGSTILASSGDGGGFDTGSGMLAGSFPATDPYVLTVNGIRTAAAGPDGNVYPNDPTIGWTNISLEPTVTTDHYETRVSYATQIAYQSYWYVPFTNYTIDRAPPSASGGFGISDWFNQSWIEHGPFMPNVGRSLGSGVSAEADFNESIFFDGAWQFEYGGTSFACPTTAGMWALILDYLQQHGQGSYLGDGNAATTLVGNAFYNGNLTLTPYFDIVNGTSFWGNYGVARDLSWPPGQNFPHDAAGNPDYGNTTVGWDFPTGWGVINVANFAQDLSTLIGLPGQFTTLTSNGLSYNPSAWANLALNNSYTFHVNGSASLPNPVVTVIFWDSSGSETFLHPALTPTSLGPGYDFTLDTANSPFGTPGYIVFEFGDNGHPTLGWSYSWIAQDISPTGHLTVQVVSPSTNSMPSGDTIYNTWLGWFTGIEDAPNGFGQPYGNSFTVLVEDNGHPVYNAQVTASIPSIYDVPFQWSTLANRTYYGLHPGAELALTTISGSYSNLTGYALVGSVNVVEPVPVAITATYGPLTATTSYNFTPTPNIKPVDNYGGEYSEANMLNYMLWAYHIIGSPYAATCLMDNEYVRNSCNQTADYSFLYGWQGEELTVGVNNYAGTPMANVPVGVGTYDVGAQTLFTDYEGSGGVFGITNTSGTSNVTDATGQATVYIPSNMTPEVGYYFGSGPYGGDYVGLDFLTASYNGQQNRTFSYSEPCYPPNKVLPTQNLISCIFNNSFQRNYTAVPLLVMPDPITIETTTRTIPPVSRDFFTTGANISVQIQVKLPNNDPFLGGTGTNWNPGLEHVVSADAYVDGVPAGNLSPTSQSLQFWYVYGNLTGDYAPGIHTLEVVVKDSLGHIFTQRHIFIVGSVSFLNFGSNNVYSSMPFNLSWEFNIPPTQFSNKTFNQSLEILYVAGGCGGYLAPCPVVVNLSLKIHPGDVDYTQNINRSLLESKGFFSGAGDLPSGQYELLVWLSANHSGATDVEQTTYLVFDPLGGQISGPGPGATVPLGNLTISYTYTGQYISTAELYVYKYGATVPVFQTGANVPGIGNHGGSSTWTAVQVGEYQIVLALVTPYLNASASEWINVTTSSPTVWINHTAPTAVGGLPTVMTATVLALIAAIIGLLLGLFAAAPMRPAKGPKAAGAGAASSAPKPWEEPSPAGSTKAKPSEHVCSICHESFQTPYALAQHAKISHGIEE
jgi:subtilase family serine protease